jgi:arginine N-succinyltransferase
MSYRVRPARSSDAEAIYQMAKLTGPGFTNLPPDRDALKAKIARSEEAFARDVDEQTDDLFMFVAERLNGRRRVVGTCQIFAKIGSEWPFYSYRISTLSQTSKALGRTFRAETLNLVTDFDGATEVGGLFLHPGERAGGIGLLLARSRYLFISLHRKRFGDRVIAELRGVVDEAGSAPFWDAVAGRFFGMSFQEADAFNAAHGNQFIADLMPKTPIYTAMLPDTGRAVMGVPHTSGRAAMKMLEQEGFRHDSYIDIFDGGPTLAVATDQIQTVHESRQFAFAGSKDGIASEPQILAAGRLAGFAACYGQIEATPDGSAFLDPDSAKLLGIEAGASFLAVGR